MQIRWRRLLKLLGYRGLSVGEMQPYIRGEREGKVFGISFDDGYRNVLTDAMPADHLPAMIGVVSDSGVSQRRQLSSSAMVSRTGRHAAPQRPFPLQ
ncbi:hypothetical protein [Burkholderia sp. Bp8963]|uniref:hypothetical protein n=1 Tax=Burkholderia sp. Bp8963 TaxID=2184547 RepID=UPI003907F800